MQLWLKKSAKLRFGAALFLGTAIYLLFDNPVPGVVLSSFQAGWSSLFTGLWLLRVDENRARGRICFLFHLGASCWQVAAAALISVLVMAFVAEFAGQQPDMKKFAATMLALAVGVVLSTLIGLGAVIGAYLYGVRVWIHPQLRDQLRITEQGEFSLPAMNEIPRRFNHAVFVMGTSLVTPLILLGTALLMVCTVGAGVDDVPVVPTILSFGVVFGGPILMIFVYAWLSRRIIATNPWECWTSGSITSLITKAHRYPPPTEASPSRRPA